jgi:phosphoadenosine phosphosulfate reductase
MQSPTELQYLQISDQLSGLSTLQALNLLTDLFPGRVVFSTSFSMEDQVITDLILSHQIPVSIFTLDTGRQFAETYSLWSRTEEKYRTRIRAYYPDHQLLEAFVSEKGPNAFYESVANRKACCHIRKVEPLKRALKGQSLWITGLRAAHSRERKDTGITEWDESNKVIKYNPLFHWPDEEVREYVRKNNLPYNPLHDKGFPSIGCAPCTRAVKPGEDLRAGRWWWEETEKKECGLHIHN